MPISLVSPMLIGALLAAPPAEPASDVPPGGYWTFADQRERREPPDGDEDIKLGAVLFSLGAIRAGAAGIMLWMSGNPQVCDPGRPEQCNGLRIYSYVGFGEGGLMLTTGIVYLAIGASRHHRHRRWQQGERISNRMRVGPWLARTRTGTLDGGGLTLSLRF